MAFKSSFVLAPLLFAAACAGAAGPDDQSGGPSGSSVDPSGQDSVAQIAGQYEVTSSFDLRDSANIPQSISDALGPLSNLSNDPAKAILDALSGTDLGNLIDSLPSFARTLIETQMNTYIQDRIYNGIPVAAQIAEYTDMIASMLTNFEVVTNLEVGSADTAGNASAEHSLTAIAFLRDGTRQVVSTPDIINALTVARDVSINVDLEASKINFGDHALDLPLGNFAVTAFHQALESQFGISDLGATLSDMVDCAGLAADIGPVQVAGFTVVTQSQLSGFCVQGLSQAALQIDAQIARIDSAQIHFMGGDGSVSTAAKADSASGSEVRTMTGTWQSEFSLSRAGFELPANFKAVRKN